jgi:hypothetical protein
MVSLTQEGLDKYKDGFVEWEARLDQTLIPACLPHVWEFPKEEGQDVL